jgi:hypothetical protein
MTIRIPSEIFETGDERIYNQPTSNKLLIISENCKSKEDLEKKHWHTFGLQTAISLIISTYYNLKSLYHTIRIGQEKEPLPDIEFVFGDSINESFACLDSNPFGLIFLGHGSDDSLSVDGVSKWTSDVDISQMINDKHGDIFMVMLPVCKSKQFGNSLEKKTDKIVLMDARYPDKVDEQSIFFDGETDLLRKEKKLFTLNDWFRNIENYITDANIITDELLLAHKLGIAARKSRKRDVVD